MARRAASKHNRKPSAYCESCAFDHDIKTPATHIASSPGGKTRWPVCELHYEASLEFNKHMNGEKTDYTHIALSSDPFNIERKWRGRKAYIDAAKNGSKHIRLSNIHRIIWAKLKEDPLTASEVRHYLTMMSETGRKYILATARDRLQDLREPRCPKTNIRIAPYIIETGEIRDALHVMRVTTEDERERWPADGWY